MKIQNVSSDSERNTGSIKEIRKHTTPVNGITTPSDKDKNPERPGYAFVCSDYMNDGGLTLCEINVVKK
jgi:hypothetical protein